MQIIAKILLVGLVFMISGCGENNKSKNVIYQDAPTYEQWQNVEALNGFMMILGGLINGGGYGGDIREPYNLQQRQMYGQYGYYQP